ncbi:Uncharacterised protein [Chlamydia trachomatis]|nr:Uncharacterised protein [Chlamydia trachomatis]
MNFNLLSLIVVSNLDVNLLNSPQKGPFDAFVAAAVD